MRPENDLQDLVPSDEEAVWRHPFRDLLRAVGEVIAMVYDNRFDSNTAYRRSTNQAS